MAWDPVTWDKELTRPNRLFPRSRSRRRLRTNLRRFGPAHLVRRAPALYWVVAAALAVLTGLTVTQKVGEAEARASRLGSLRQVPVAARALEAGQVLRAADVELRPFPAAFLPRGTLAREPAGHATLVALLPGEPLMQAKLAPWGVHGVTALLPAGAKGLAVPVAPGGPSLERGDHVDVLATFDPEAGGGAEPTFPVAAGAKVIDVSEETVTVAVSPEEAPRLAFALSHGTVAVALTAQPP